MLAGAVVLQRAVATRWDRALQMIGIHPAFQSNLKASRAGNAAAVDAQLMAMPRSPTIASSATVEKAVPEMASALNG